VTVSKTTGLAAVVVAVGTDWDCSELCDEDLECLPPAEAATGV